ncbi:MAG: hypothetical protein R2939_03380 [Kofleriaceae bacterium]
MVSSCLDDAAEVRAAARQVQARAASARQAAIDRLYGDLATHGDAWRAELAARAAELGVSEPRHQPSLPDVGSRGVPTLTGEMARRLAEYGARLRAGRDAAVRAGDRRTAALLDEIEMDVDDDRWFIEALAER